MTIDYSRCQECGQPLDTYIQPGLLRTSPVSVYGTCRTAGCNRQHVTMEIHDLAALTQAQVDSLVKGRQNGEKAAKELLVGAA